MSQPGSNPTSGRSLDLAWQAFTNKHLSEQKPPDNAVTVDDYHADHPEITRDSAAKILWRAEKEGELCSAIFRVRVNGRFCSRRYYWLSPK